MATTSSTNVAVGQYGKQNPLFMYQGTAGFSVEIAAIQSGKNAAQGYTTQPASCGVPYCGQDE